MRVTSSRSKAPKGANAFPLVSGAVSPLPGIDLADSSRTDRLATEGTATRSTGRQKCHPVRHRGTMTTNGWRSENADWLDMLTEPHPTMPGVRIGRDPMGIDPQVLTMAGHPPRGTHSMISAKRAAMGDADHLYGDVREYSHIPAGVCLACSDGNSGQVRRCAVIGCPVWAYRTGRNPHSTRRGKTPASFAALVKSRDAGRSAPEDLGLTDAGHRAGGDLDGSAKPTAPLVGGRVEQ